MLYNGITDIVQPDSQPSGTAALTRTFRIKREPRRIDNIKIKVRLDQGAVAATGAAWAGAAGVVKEIRVRIADGGTTRNVFQVTGPALLSFAQFATVENLDRNTLMAYRSSGFPVSITHEITYTLNFSDVRLEDPFRHVTGLPLWLLGDDVIVEVDLWDIAAAGTVFTANPPTYNATNALLALVRYREGTESLPYIPIEVRTDTGFAPGTTSNVPYEFSSIGFLTAFMVQTYSAQAMAAAVTRSTLLAANGLFRLEYGRKVVERTDVPFKTAEQDLMREVQPDNALCIGTGGTLQANNFAGEFYWDFLRDSPGTAAFSVRSVVDLRQEALAGDKFRLFLNDLAATTRGIHITTHRLLPNTTKDLDALMRNL